MINNCNNLSKNKNSSKNYLIYIPLGVIFTVFFSLYVIYTIVMEGAK